MNHYTFKLTYFGIIHPNSSFKNGCERDPLGFEHNRCYSDNWNNCRNSTLKNIKSPTDGGGEEGEDEE